MYFTVLLVVRNGFYVIEYIGVHSVQAANTSLLFYHASQQTVNADGLQDNSQDRKTKGIKTAVYAPSIRPDLCI